jgi:hypothetical protein
MFGEIAARSGRRAERTGAYSDCADRLNPNIVFSKRDSYQRRGHLTVSEVASYRLTLPRTQFRYNRGAQMTQQRSRFLDKKDGVCAIAARHRPSARPTRRRLATRIVLASTHHTCSCIPRTHTQFRMSRPPSRARIRAAETFEGFCWPGACTGTQIVTVFTGK